MNRQESTLTMVSKRNGAFELPVHEARRHIPWTKLELTEYLTENIHYRLGEAEIRSLSLFFEKAVKHGFAAEHLPLGFL